jgi:hypothetical protein
MRPGEPDLGEEIATMLILMGLQLLRWAAIVVPVALVIILTLLVLK